MGTSPDLASDRSSPYRFVGREAELVVLRACYAEVLAGHGRLVLISGEAGIGKTALVQAFTHELDQDEALILHGNCYDLSTTPPYGLWLELADRYRAELELPKLFAILTQGIDDDEVPTQLALFETVRDFFDALSRTRPLVMVLEDLHWADQASIDLLRYLSRHLESRRILLIATYRDDEVTRQHPLFPFVPVLVRESLATRVELGTLTQDDVKMLVRGRWLLAAEDETRLSEHLLASTEGHPLFTVEILRTLEQEGIIHQTNAGWQVDELRNAPVPVLVQQVIER